MIEDDGQSINLVPILERKRQMFHLNNGVVEYIGPALCKTDAMVALQKMIVEGIFIYFFAKFNKSHEFKIKYPFYSKSEPIRTVMVTVTGQQSINYALQFYFDVMKDVFHFDSETCMLTLTK